MAGLIPLGVRRDSVPIPPVEENTVYVSAGPISIGVEFRVLTSEMLQAHYRRQAILDKAIAEFGSLNGIDECGISLHVFDAASGAEYLRFDAFGDQHYHYIQPGSHHEVHMFDYFANGEMTEWAIQSLSCRAKAMLEHAGADHLSRRLDQHELDEAISEVRTIVQRLREKDAPSHKP